MNNDRLIEKLGEWEEQLQNYGVLLLDDHAIFGVICKLLENRPKVDEKFIEKWARDICPLDDERNLIAVKRLLFFMLKEAGVEIDDGRCDKCNDTGWAEIAHGEKHPCDCRAGELLRLDRFLAER